MAVLEDLIAKISDQSLRGQIEAAVADLKRRKRFGLVFEEHIPEITALVDLPVQIGTIVQRRDGLNGGKSYRVISVDAQGTATVEPSDGSGEPEQVRTRDLLVVKRFGEPIYPALVPVGSVMRGGEAKPHHAVINGENFHALQLFTYLYEGQVDCIYIDPPYNTGARDWKYNNRYVDANDAWRHSKWLSMMEKRLRLARRLLKSDGVLIVTIDEHEVHHLGMLLERLFPDLLRYMVTIVINPKGTAKTNFARVDEQALFVVPDIGRDVILGRSLHQQLSLPMDDQNTEEDTASIDQNEEEEDELDTETEDSETESDEEPELEDADSLAARNNGDWEYQHARRRGSESSYRPQRPNQFYPIYIDEANRTVARIGTSIPLEQEPDFTPVDGLRPIWPIDAEGRHRCWRFVPESMQRELDAGNLALGKYNRQRDSWTINIRRPKKVIKKLKTVWWPQDRNIYDAGTHGTELLRRLLGKPGLFPFPKSVYNTRDCLATVVQNRPNALIVDFFAGSGTTFHATCLLNAEDGGQRRCILVTNNEVTERVARALNKQGYFQGDPEFEAHGIFEEVTRPRCEAVVTGRRPDGNTIPGKHVNGRPFHIGFDERIGFFHLSYLDPDEVDLGRQFAAIAPSLWLAAGGVGSWEEADPGTGFSLPVNSTYGVLFKESRFRQFKDALSERPNVTHVWLVTDSEEAYAEMRSSLSAELSVSMLYRDYLRNFRINTEQNL